MKSVALLIALFAFPALAHDTWIAPERFTGACGAATLHMTSAAAFGPLDYAIEPGRVARAVAIVPKRRVTLKPEKAPHSLDFRVDVPASGVVMVAVELAPKTLDLNAAEVSEYLDEIAAPDAIRAEWKAHPGRWRERYTKHAKTFLRCGASDGAFQRDAEMGLELVPQGTDPTVLKAGDTIRVALIENRQLLRDVAIVLQRDGVGRVAVAKPDAKGIASFVLPQAGRYLLTATHLRRGDGKDADWISDFTTLTFAVR
jgi:Domain of unknown function (DUF4198)